MDAGEASGSGPGQDASTRHMQTEKRRRDRIASGFEALRGLIPCKDRKLDKATFLQEVVDYVSSLQDAVQQAVSLGGIQSLPEETQWQIRLLLPRQPSEGRGGAAASGRGAEAVGPSAARQPAAGAGVADEMAGPSGMQQHDTGLSQVAAGGASASGSASRVQQLQAVLRQLQSQQATSARQYQLQQAALVQSQFFGALQHFAQQPLPQLQGSPANMLQQAGLALGQQFPGQVPHAQPQPPAQQAPAEATGRDKPQGSGGASAAAAADRSLPKPRRAGKIRRHTTAARMSNPHSKPSSNSSGSESGNSGRPDMSPLAQREPTNEPLNESLS